MGSIIPNEIKYNPHYGEVRGDVLQPPHGTKHQKWPGQQCTYYLYTLIAFSMHNRKNNNKSVRGVALTSTYLYTCLVFELEKSLNLKCEKMKEIIRGLWKKKKTLSYLQTMIKTPVKCQKNWRKSVGGVALIRYLLPIHFQSIRAQKCGARTIWPADDLARTIWPRTIWPRMIWQQKNNG